MKRGEQRKKIKNKIKDKIYLAGIVITLFGCAGIAQAITDNTVFITPAIIFSIGFACVLYGYTDMLDPGKDPYKNL